MSLSESLRILVREEHCLHGLGKITFQNLKSNLGHYGVGDKFHMVVRERVKMGIVIQ